MLEVSFVRMCTLLMMFPLCLPRFVEVIIAKPIGLVLTKSAIPAIADYSTDSE